MHFFRLVPFRLETNATDSDLVSSVQLLSTRSYLYRGSIQLSDRPTGLDRSNPSFRTYTQFSHVGQTEKKLYPTQ